MVPAIGCAAGFITLPEREAATRKEPPNRVRKTVQIKV